MGKYILYILTGVAVSFGFFPFEFSFLPGINTKMLLAVGGLLVLLQKFIADREPSFSRDFIVALLFAVVVSAIGFLSVAVNGTSDYTYSTYVVSFLVWMASAYFIVRLVRAVHGKASVRLLCDYLIAVCVAQCALALMIDYYSPLKDFVDGLLATEGFMGKVEGRLYGIGCGLDVAGTRFSAVLVILMFMAFCQDNVSSKTLVWYIFAWLAIAVVGNMIARTTTVGVVLSLLVGLWKSGLPRLRLTDRCRKMVLPTVLILAVSLPLLAHLYNTNPKVRTDIRFAFEGFFSLVETGRWETNSNNRLMTMIVFPDNLKTWTVGDGLFNNPLDSDPYYIGKGVGDYYMSTDIGYLRFIFYFGIIGLTAFVLYFVKITQICARRFPKHKELFVLLLVLNFIIWFKVATDIFLVFSFFLLPREEEAITAIDA